MRSGKGLQSRWSGDILANEVGSSMLMIVASIILPPSMLTPNWRFFVAADLVGEESLVADVGTWAEDCSLAHDDVPKRLVEKPQGVSILSYEPFMEFGVVLHKWIS